MQSGPSQGPVGDDDKMTFLGRHRPALALWAVLLVSFLLFASLYPLLSEPFLLRVFEIMQIHRAQIEGRSVNQAIVDYEDYLRVDPESIRIRGLIVDAFIEKRDFQKAAEHALSALDLATEEQRPFAGLMAARVYLAKNDLDDAVPHVQSVLDANPNSGEAHYQMAQLLLAQGRLEDAEQEFARLKELGPKDSTEEYSDAWNARLEKLAEYQREIEAGVESPQRLYELGMEFQKMGRLDEAKELYSKIEPGADIQRASNNAFEIPAFDFRGAEPV